MTECKPAEMGMETELVSVQTNGKRKKNPHHKSAFMHCYRQMGMMVVSKLSALLPFFVGSGILSLVPKQTSVK